LLRDRDRQVRDLEKLLASEVHRWKAKRDAERERTQRARKERDDALAELSAAQHELDNLRAAVAETARTASADHESDAESPTVRIAKRLRSAVATKQEALREQELASMKQELEASRARIHSLENRMIRSDVHLALLHDELADRRVVEPPLQLQFGDTWEELEFDQLAFIPPKPTHNPVNDDWESDPQETAALEVTSE
jgi:hypothetical protein